ncbi:MAG TPA: hypothetical protein VMY59_03920 [Candidatus Thermoplasmatota archaeon]|nr:hypothetical protein [Candidatus Thermoplasmatota archaeon]
MTESKSTIVESESAIIEDQIKYYKKEFAASMSEANRQYNIAADLAMKIMDLEEKLCQMKK